MCNNTALTCNKTASSRQLSGNKTERCLRVERRLKTERHCKAESLKAERCLKALRKTRAKHVSAWKWNGNTSFSLDGNW
eukprot:11221966-Lingulodinium_polyedra.AAC.1